MGELQSLASSSSTAASGFLRVSSAPFSSPSFSAGGCDIQILQSSQPRSAVNVGVAVIVVFFVLLICAICISFTCFKLRKREAKKKLMQQQQQGHGMKRHGGQETTGFTNNALDLQEQQQQQRGYSAVPLNNVMPQSAAAQQPQSRFPPKAKMRTPHQPQRPDLLAGGGDLGGSPYRDLVNQSPAADNLFPENAEHYDIENASSIAPSDIDVVYHYKGYRDGVARGEGAGGTGARYRRSGGSKSLTGKGRRGRQQQQQLNNTPLARLSPSSEMSHNPRILTLGDLSGKSLPPGLLVEQSERSLNSPVSHVSSNSRQSHRHHLQQQQQQHRGLTSENVARFNSSQSPHHHVHPSASNGHKSPSILNSLDVLQSGGGPEGDGASSHSRGQSRARGSRSASRFSDPRKTPLSHAGGDGASSSSSTSSSDDGGDDDSFTCSEYEYDGGPQAQNGEGGGGGGNVSTLKDTSADASGMVFSKLASSPPPPPPPAAIAAAAAAAAAAADSSSADEGHGDTTPSSQGKTWESLLSWSPNYQSLAGVFRDIAELPHGDPDVCRPSPLGDHHPAAATEEQYI